MSLQISQAGLELVIVQVGRITHGGMHHAGRFQASIELRDLLGITPVNVGNEGRIVLRMIRACLLNGQELTLHHVLGIGLAFSLADDDRLLGLPVELCDSILRSTELTASDVTRIGPFLVCTSKICCFSRRAVGHAWPGLRWCALHLPQQYRRRP